MKLDLAIVGAGAVTPVGLGALPTAMACRAAAAVMREAPLADASGEGVTMCFLPIYDPRLEGRERAITLGARAFEEALASIGPLLDGARVKVLVTFDEDTAERYHPLSQAAKQITQSLPSASVEGSTGGPGAALSAAAESLASGAFDIVVWGGVHTDYDVARIAALARADRLFRPDNLDSLIPGEGAAFVALMRPKDAKKRGARAFASIQSAAWAKERARPDNDEPAFRATGLTAALRGALDPLLAKGLAAGWVMTDLSFESYRLYEFQAATTRLSKALVEPYLVDSPAQRIGALGAAAAPLHLTLAAEAYRRAFAPHAHGISITGSEGGDRSVILFGAPPP